MGSYHQACRMFDMNGVSEAEKVASDFNLGTEVASSCYQRLKQWIQHFTFAGGRTK